MADFKAGAMQSAWDNAISAKSNAITQDYYETGLARQAAQPKAGELQDNVLEAMNKLPPGTDTAKATGKAGSAAAPDAPAPAAAPDAEVPAAAPAQTAVQPAVAPPAPVTTAAPSADDVFNFYSAKRSNQESADFLKRLNMTPAQQAEFDAKMAEFNKTPNRPAREQWTRNFIGGLGGR